MSFRVINDAPDSVTGISPTTMVFGVHPKIPGAGHRETMAQRATVIRICTKKFIELRYRKLVKGTLCVRSMPSMAEIDKLCSLNTGENVLVYREKNGWQLNTLVRVRDNELDAILPKGHISTFPMSVVCLFLEKRENENSTEPKGKKVVTFREPIMTSSKTLAKRNGSEKMTVLVFLPFKWVMINLQPSWRKKYTRSREKKN